MAALNLTSLGAELDAIRRQRAPSSSSVDTASTGTSPLTPPLLSAPLPFIADTEADDDAIRIDTPRIDTPKPQVAQVEQEKKEQPFATCLLCFQRPPSAVLLPCEYPPLHSLRLVDDTADPHFPLLPPASGHGNIS